MSSKTIPERVVVTCDCCLKPCAEPCLQRSLKDGEVRRHHSAWLGMGTEAYFEGNPLTFTQKSDLCDGCYTEISQAIIDIFQKRSEGRRP